MNKLTTGICIAAFAITSGTIKANELTLTSHDDSIYTQVCIAAVRDGDRFEQLLNQYGLDEALVRCNDKPLSTFVKKMAVDKSVATMFVGSNESAATALCLAATKSPMEFERIKNQLFPGRSDKVNRIICNEIPLNEFANRFSREAIEG